MTDLQKEASFDATNDRKTVALARIAANHLRGKSLNLLVVGCGTGREAGVLARYFDIDTIGIDIGHEYEFDRENATPAKLEIMDAHALKFPDKHFDIVYSFHALEHMTDPQLVLREMARVLKPNGTFILGTPNKARLVGYLGSGTARRNKLKWNLADWAARLRGKWHNEAGAHAGFTQRELLSLTSASFDAKSILISDDYYSELYNAQLFQWLKKMRITHWVYPCVYVLGRKQESGA
jgi:SAM-dependent methyltransferase